MAISFALDQLLTIPRHAKHKIKEVNINKSKPIGSIADNLIAKLDRLGNEIQYKDLEDIIVSALKASGIRLLSTSQQGHDADMAIWSDELQADIGNPLIIEVKKKVSNQNIRSIIETVNRSVSVNSHWVLVLYNEGPLESSYRTPSKGSFSSTSFSSKSFTVPTPGIIFLNIICIKCFIFKQHMY